MKKWLVVLAAAVMAFAASPVQAESSSMTKVEVMTQNLYIGADLSRLLAGEPPSAILATVLQTNYPERAVEAAAAILDRNPDLVGLQEAWDITVTDPFGNPVIELDYLDILLQNLEAQGGTYEVASFVKNADVTLPVDEFGTLARVVDRDVILYRTDTTSIVEDSAFSATFATNFTVQFPPPPEEPVTEIEFTRGYTAVDAEVAGLEFRFVNTHLEVEGAPCGLRLCQDAQAEELRDALADETLPVLLVGDFNAVPGTYAYTTIDDAGYRDTWTVSPGFGQQPGFTCCQDEDLLNPVSKLSQRIDHVFIEEDGIESIVVNAKVVGDSEDEERTPSGLWYSDHGGVWIKLHLGE